MLNLADLNLRPDSRVLRQFAGAWLVFLGGMGAWKVFTQGPTPSHWALLIVGVAIGTLGLIAPRAIRWIYAGAMILAFPIGFVVSRVLLGVVYYGLITPMGFAMRMSGRDRLRIKRAVDDGGGTFWTPRVPSNVPASYLRQF